MKPNSMFKPFESLFENLVKTSHIESKFPIVTAMILYDSSGLLTVTKASEELYFITIYTFKSMAVQIKKEIRGKYIKMKDVEQSLDAKSFVAAYNDDGVFKLRYFSRGYMFEETDLNLNDLLGIDSYTMVVDNLPDPFITCCFVSNHVVFVNLFYNYSLRHFHFLYNIEKK